MPQYVDAGVLPFLGAFNPNVSRSISVDIAITPRGDFYLNPVGDLNAVTGNQKLIQDIMLFLLSPVGSSLFDPTWGNPVLEMMGTAETAPGQLNDLVRGALIALKSFKDKEKTIRQTEASELIDSIGDVNVVETGLTGNKFEIEIHLTTYNQNMFITRIPLNTTGG